MESFAKLNLCMTELAITVILGDKQSVALIGKVQHLMTQLSCS